MRSAIYYPHTTIRSSWLLKSALLLWDEVHVIVPWKGFINWDFNPSRDQAAAFEIVGRAFCPSKEQKRLTHGIVEDFVSRSLPKGFFLSPQDDADEYEMFTRKLLPETWELLHYSRTARPSRDRPSHYSATAPMGLALMNILADCCAGEVFARITDRSDAYASLSGLFSENDVDTADESSEQLLPEFGHAGDREALVPIATEVIDAKSLTLKKLIALRNQEAKSSGYAIRDLRHRFADGIERQVNALSGARTEFERDEIKRQFRQEMRDDYSALREALKLEADQVFGMKEIIATALIPLGYAGGQLLGIPDAASTLSLTSAAVAIGGLYSVKSKFAQARRKILVEHPSAYLYEAKGGLRL